MDRAPSKIGKPVSTDIIWKLTDKFGPWAFLAVMAWLFWGHIEKQQERQMQWLIDRNAVDVQMAKSIEGLASAVKIIGENFKKQ